MTKWLEADTRPVIYMSMGSIYQMPESVLNMFKQVQSLLSLQSVKKVIFKVFDMLPLRVVWKRKDKLITDKFYQVLDKFW